MRRTRGATAQRLPIVGAIMAVSLVRAATAARAALARHLDVAAAQIALSVAAITGLAALGAALIVFSALWHVAAWRGSQASRSTAVAGRS